MAIKKVKNQIDKKLLLFVVTLMIFGFIMVVSASTVIWINFGPKVFATTIIKNIIFIIVGIISMAFIQQKFNWAWIEKRLPILVTISVLLMFTTLFFAPINGANAWLDFKVFSIQPVEFFKIVMIIFLANHFDSNYNNNKPAKAILRLPIIFVGSAFLFILGGQNDLGSGLIVLLIAYCMFLALPEKKFFKGKVISIIILLVFIIIIYSMGPKISDMIFKLPADFPMKVQLLRIATLFDPLKYIYTVGFQVVNSLVAIVEGSFFGHGLGNSITKMIVPEPMNDAIIAVIAEELGLLGVFILFSLYILIVNRLLAFAQIPNMRQRDRLVLVGIASLFIAQFFVNVGGMSGLIPMTGVTLLFVSSGGSSLISAFTVIGIAQGVIKRYKK